MGKISARNVLTPSGWIADCTVQWGDDGRIDSVSKGGFEAGEAVGVLVPGVANVHTHSFQRAMAGLAERRGPTAHDDFWTWRKVMYRFLEILTPDHVEAIAAMVQAEMAEAGFTASAEFHYLHHQPGGAAYDDPAEMSRRILAASTKSGIGLTLLPVLYTHGGFDRRELNTGQRRFGCDIERFETLFAAIRTAAREMSGDFRLGVAPHSLRAVDADGLAAALALCPEGPVHIHAAEQVKEVEESQEALGARPVRWLLDNLPVDRRFCLIHATHLDDGETANLAQSGAVAGLCPTTEANLGDGIFPASDFLAAGGTFGIGSDSNVRLSLSEELRMLEVSQRLLHRRRTVLTTETAPSNGRNLLERAARGGAQAVGRATGEIAVGQLADLVALRDDRPFLDWPEPDTRLDSWIFALGNNAVDHVWSAGRHIVGGGRHVRREAIERRFAGVMSELGGML